VAHKNLFTAVQQLPPRNNKINTWSMKRSGGWRSATMLHQAPLRNNYRVLGLFFVLVFIVACRACQVPGEAAKPPLPTHTHARARARPGARVQRCVHCTECEYKPETQSVGFQVLKATSMKTAVVWDVAPCSLVEIDRCGFKEIGCYGVD
jgi:hypothetical protein